MYDFSSLLEKASEREQYQEVVLLHILVSPPPQLSTPSSTKRAEKRGFFLMARVNPSVLYITLLLPTHPISHAVSNYCRDAA